MSDMENRPCDDCAGFDYEWMKSCAKHGTHFCRGCSCPVCAEEDDCEDHENGDYDFEEVMPVVPHDCGRRVASQPAGDRSLPADLTRPPAQEEGE